MSTHHIAKGTPVRHRRWADIFGVVTHVSSIDGTITVRWNRGEATDESAGWTADELIVIPKLHTMPERNTQTRRRVGTGIIVAASNGGHVTTDVYFNGERARNAFGHAYGWRFRRSGSLLFV